LGLFFRFFVVELYTDRRNIFFNHFEFFPSIIKIGQPQVRNIRKISKLDNSFSAGNGVDQLAARKVMHVNQLDAGKIGG